MSLSLEIQWNGEDLVLLPERGVWWPAQQMLVVADLHLGKASKFGLFGSPPADEQTRLTLRRLDAMIERHDPSHIMLLGDLFDDREGKRGSCGELFASWMRSHPGRDICLALGRHDGKIKLGGLGLVTQPSFTVGPFQLQHAAEESDGSGMVGHLHPGVNFRGERLPCFWVNNVWLVLPACGEFTGVAIMAGGANGARIFAVTGSEVIEFPS